MATVASLDLVVWLAALAAGVWSLGAAKQGRLSMLEVALIAVAALATACAATGLTDLYHVFKPLAMVLAIAFAIQRGLPSMLLLAALLFSLAGDVFLMLPGQFIPGLVSFLIPHLCYIALFRRDAPWFASRRALATTLAAAALMYAVLFAHLGPVLKVAVAAYAVVIALMAAQAIGRATVMRTEAAIGVATGAVFFMLSDSILAINKFAMPLPMADLAILGTYYTAQILIVRNAAALRAA